MSARLRWITFDCFGTLVDWHAGFAAALRPLVENMTEEVLRAYHAHERIVEGEARHRSYKDVLVTALVGAASECGIPLSLSAARELPAELNATAADTSSRACAAASS